VLQADEVLRPCAQNAHRLLITAVLLSAKLMDDNIYNNSYWAKARPLSAALPLARLLLACNTCMKGRQHLSCSQPVPVLPVSHMAVAPLPLSF
jgi:hypothetical protein